MKLLELDLRAFGSFSGRRLDFRAGEHGLHVVYGPNEAGKSTALRALRALLYGVPERSRDGFLHDARALRVGGVLRGADGRELVVYRRKGRKNTLLDANDAPLADDALAGLIAQVDEGAFERLFGIDHPSLVSGGEQLLADRGREAAALFSSGLGGIDVNAVLQHFARQADELFRRGGSKPSINAELTRLADLEQQLRRSALSATEWDNARKAVQRCLKAVEQVDAGLSEARLRRGVLERIRRNLPLFLRLDLARERLRELGEVVVLPEDFAARHRDAAERRRIAQEQIEIARGACERLRAQIAGRSVCDELLAAAATVESLREQLGGIRKAAADRPTLQAAQRNHAGRAARALAMLAPGAAPGHAEAMRPQLAARQSIESQGRKLEVCEAELRRIAAAQAASAAAVDGARQALADMPAPIDTERLQAALDAARRLGDIDAEVSAQGRRLAQHDASVSRELGAIGLWSASIEALCSAPLPQAETLERFAGQYLAIEQDESRCAEQEVEFNVRLEQAGQQLRALELAGRVPSEADLQAARAHRAAGWSLLHRRFVAHEDVDAAVREWAPEQDLPAAFEGAVERADEVADRLRREAGRVQQQAAVAADRETCELRLQGVQEKHRALQRQRLQLDASWTDAWRAAGVDPRGVAEMKAWRERAARLCETARGRDELLARHSGLQDARQRHRQHLASELALPGGAAPDAEAEAQCLAPLVHCAEAFIKRVAGEARTRAEAVTKLQSAQQTERDNAGELRAMQQEHQRARANWQASLERAGIDTALAPQDVFQRLDQLAELLRDYDEAAAYEARITGIDADFAQFAAAVAELTARAAPELGGSAPEAALLAVASRLAEHQRLNTEREAERKELANAGQALDAANNGLKLAVEELSALCAQARCDDVGALDEAERRSRDWQAADTAVRDVVDDLLRGADGRRLEELEAELRAADRDRVNEEFDRLVERIDQQLTPERDRLLAELQEAQRVLREMSGGAGAADLALQVEQSRARLVTLGRDYVRCKLAHRILGDAIERYRSEHRDPILLRAGAYLQELTCGGFSSIASEIGEDDEAVLAGVRAGGDRLRVDAMSTGTRDQLFLALRLATIEQIVRASEPMPFVVDDILIQFDDRRADATLATLADFSRHTQVILFTHHLRDMECARRLAQHGGGVFLHELG